GPDRTRAEALRRMSTAPDQALRESEQFRRVPGLEGLSIADLMHELLAKLGENPRRHGLERTPQRIANSLAELTVGYSQTVHEVVGQGVFAEDCSEMVMVKDIEFYSLCEHHMLPFFGRVHVAYIPDGRIIGLSKIPRIVDVFARRLQVQE